MSAKVCNICGCDRFTSGPGQRSSDTKLPPYCTGCGSLERHRALRSMYLRLQQAIPFADFEVLQISDDSTVSGSWFRSITVSIYGGANSVDIQNPPHPNDTFDLIICNHVLEHVPDDRCAIRELVRILKPNGILQIGIPDPLRRPLTEDWGYPRSEDHGHFRLYGIDVLQMFREQLSDCYLVTVRFTDPVTLMEDLYFLFTRSEETADTLRSILPEAALERMKGDGRQHAVGPLKAPLRALARIAADRDGPRASPEYRQYVVEGAHKTIPGWVTEGALTATGCLAGLQDQLCTGGSVCEIGVHHGRFFIAMVNMAPEVPALAVDVFENQAANIDRSGCGDLHRFTNNVERFAANPGRIRTLEADSLTIDAGAILSNLDATRVRLFSVDGGHTPAHLLNDLALAEQALAPYGVAIVDDFYNPHWPGVSEGVFRYLQTPTATTLLPFAYGDNKLYLAAVDNLPIFRAYVRHGLKPLALDYKEVELFGWPACYLRMPSATDLYRKPVQAESEMPRRSVFLTNLEVLELTGLWHPAEVAGCWTGATRSGVRVKCVSTAPKSQLTGSLAAVVSPQHSETTITLLVDGIVSATGVFAGTHTPIEVHASLEGLDVSRPIHIEFATDYAVSPSHIGLSSDRRILGVYVQSLKLG